MKNRHLTCYYAGIIALATIAVYGKALQNDFVDWDDKMYLIDNVHLRSFDWAFIRWAFLDFHAANWHPLTWISHAADVAVWGLNPRGHHLTNILIHALNTVLVMLLATDLLDLRRERNRDTGISEVPEGRGALIVAGATAFLFGLHPLHVESVAWAAERKDLLCGFFFLMSIRAHLRYVRSAEAFEGRSFFRQPQYLLSLCFFVLALASKPMAVTLPFVLMILDWYPAGRVRRPAFVRVLVLEKLPFMLLSVGSSIVTVLAQRSGGALVPLEHYALPVRVLVALQSLVGYLGHMLLPLDLLPYYSYPESASFLSWRYFIPALMVAGTTAAVVRLAGRRPLWPALWGYYVVTLLPVLGIVQVGNQAMADRYTYLPGLAPILLAGLGAERVWKRVKSMRRFRRAAVTACAAAVLVLAASLVYLTAGQIGVWKDGITLWDHVLCINPRAGAIPYNNRGELYYRQGRFDRALEDLNQAVLMAPGDPSFVNNRGLALERNGRLPEAMADYSRAISLSSDYAMAYYNRGILSFRLGNRGDALADFDKAIAIDPSDATYYNNRGITLASLDRPDDALADFTRALRLDPDHLTSYLNRANVLLATGRQDSALADFQKACDLGSSEGCEAVQDMQKRLSPPHGRGRH